MTRGGHEDPPRQRLRVTPPRTQLETETLWRHAGLDTCVLGKGWCRCAPRKCPFLLKPPAAGATNEHDPLPPECSSEVPRASAHPAVRLARQRQQQHARQHAARPAAQGPALAGWPWRASHAAFLASDSGPSYWVGCCVIVGRGRRCQPPSDRASRVGFPLQWLGHFAIAEGNCKVNDVLVQARTMEAT